MKKGLKSALSVLLVLMLMLSVVQISVSAAQTTPMTIKASTKSALPGASVNIDISLKNNPGVASLGLDIAYNKNILTLENVTYNSELGGKVQTSPLTDNPAKILWVNSSAEFKSDAVFATLTFKVSENAKSGVKSPITLTYDQNNIYNIKEVNVDCAVENGAVTITDLIPGDINKDKAVNNKDVTRLMQYLAHWNVEVNAQALDTNGDKAVNNKDVSRLMQYLAHWDVELHPNASDFPDDPDENCKHNITRVDAVLPTCEKEGRKAYYQCSVCGKKFTDISGQSEVSEEDLIIEKLEHTVVIDPPVHPTASSTGKTEGSHCAVCKKVLVAQETIPATENYIIFNLAGENPYLQKQVISPNNSVVYDPSKTTKLRNASCPGYQFLGWYDLPEGAAAENIKEIPAGTEGEIELYAWWRAVPYNIEFKSDLIPVAPETYTVEHSKVLPVPVLGGYIFAGWSDEEGNIIKTIPEGTTGHKTYYANWLSERNQAWAKQSVGDPVAIVEDDATNTILFAYEIGEIRNVPLTVIEDFGKINSDGVSKEVTKEISRSVNSSQMDNYTKTVQKVTTDSYGWSLSNEWSEGMSVDQEWATEHGMSVEEAEIVCKNKSNNWYVSNGTSGSDSTVTLDTKDKYNLKTTTTNKKTYDTHDDEVSDGAHLTSKIGGDMTPAQVGSDVYAEEKHSDKTGTEKDKGSENQGGNIKHTGTESTHNSSWNSESGYGGSESVSKTNSVTRALTEKISSKTGYGKNYIQNENHTSTQGYSAADTNGEQYSSSVTYSIVEGEKETVTYRTTNTKSGYHRWVYAGTAHVFGVVGYDIKTSSYFVYTTSVMDDEVHPFEDYSYSYSDYADNQNTILPFEVPFGIEKYVASRVCGSEGLVVSKEGEVTGYNGEASYVCIPEYTVLDNRDGTKSVVKITGIKSNALSGKPITGVVLSDFITDIPSRAFENCTNLWEFNAYSIESIGDLAFKNCLNLESFIIGATVKHLGENVVEGLDKLTAYASDKSIVEAAVKSGAKEIVVSIDESCNNLMSTELKIDNSTQCFTFNGLGKTFKNVVIDSDAQKTIINRAKFVSTGKTPVKISSSDVELNDVEATAPGIATILSADTTNLSILGTVKSSADSKNSLLCKSLAIDMLDQSIYSEVVVDGNLLICGEIIEGNNYIKAPVTIVKISDEEFEKYYKGTYRITFNPSGGIIDEQDAAREIFVGTKYGELPVATKDYCSFTGWFTKADGGTQITKDTVFEGSADVTLYAQWEDNPVSDWVLADKAPADAKIDAEKWTYDETKFTTSSSSTMTGWEKYNETWKWSDWGSWSGWSTNAVSSSDTVNVETRWVKHYKTQYNYSKWSQYSNGNGKNGPWKGNWGGVACNYYFERGWSDSQLRWDNNSQGFDMWGTPGVDVWYNQSTRQVENGGHTEYRYRTRYKIYTYYFKKTESKESNTEVQPYQNTDIMVDNVQKWVKYISK